MRSSRQRDRSRWQTGIEFNQLTTPLISILQATNTSDGALTETERRSSIGLFLSRADPVVQGVLPSSVLPNLDAGAPGNRSPVSPPRLMPHEDELFEHISKLKKDKGRQQGSDKAHGPVFMLIKHPILFVIGIFVFVELLGYILVRLCVTLWEWFRSLTWSRSRREAQRLMYEAGCYPEWLRAAKVLDQVEGKSSVRDTREEVSTQHLTRHLRYHIDAGNISSLADDLQAACVPDRSGW